MLVRENGVHSLVIEPVTSRDAGIYTCIASNRAGQNSFNLELIVAGKHKYQNQGISPGLTPQCTLVTHVLHSQRDTQAPFICGEAAEHKRCRGSSCAAGVPRHWCSLPTDLLEEGEWVIHSQHRQNKVNRTAKRPCWCLLQATLAPDWCLSMLSFSQHAPGQLWLPVYDNPASHERRCWLVHSFSQEWCRHCVQHRTPWC